MPAELKSVSTGVGFRTQYVEVASGVFAPAVVVVPSLDGTGTGTGTASSAVTVADGADATFGKKDDAAAAADGTTASYMSLFRRLLGKFPISIGAKTAAGSLSVTLASDDAGVGTKIDAAPALGAGGTGLIGWLSTVARRLTPGATTGAASLPVVIASDDAMVGTPITAAGALGTGGTGLMGWLSTLALRLPASLGLKASAASLPVVLASDDAQIGTKVAAVPALASGGAGLIGWLSAQWQSLSNLALQLPATLGAKTGATSLSVVPATDANLSRESYTVTPLSVSLTTGATPIQMTGQACTQFELVNNTGVSIEYRRGAGGTIYIGIPDGGSRLIQGIANANELWFRRVDQLTTATTVVGEAFA